MYSVEINCINALQITSNNVARISVKLAYEKDASPTPPSSLQTPYSPLQVGHVKVPQNLRSNPRDANGETFPPLKRG